MDLESLTGWFATHQRALPWREPGTSAWGVLVSEVMLQQTPVARVEPVWREWMALWPTPAHLAAASVADAVRMWATLGYPRRAKNLHQQAVQITSRHDGGVPSDVDELLALPGIGHYTARAVASFAYGERHPVADTNVTRVIARVEDGVAFGGHWSMSFAMSKVDDALRIVPDADYPKTNLAIMELGALVCRARSPLCEDCPLLATCGWRRSGYPVDEAVKPKKQARYEGSDRQARGRILRALRESSEPVGLSTLLATHSPHSQAKRALDSLVSDGLITEVDPVEEPRFALPEGD